jgi:hypothetical protein
MDLRKVICGRNSSHFGISKTTNLIGNTSQESRLGVAR